MKSLKTTYSRNVKFLEIGRKFHSHCPSDCFGIMLVGFPKLVGIPKLVTMYSPIVSQIFQVLKLRQFNTLKQTKGTVIPCCESPQCILDGTTEGAKGEMKGWITRGRPVANPKQFRKRQKVGHSDDVKMVTNIIPTKLKMRTSSRKLPYYHSY